MLKFKQFNNDNSHIIISPEHILFNFSYNIYYDQFKGKLIKNIEKDINLKVKNFIQNIISNKVKDPNYKIKGVIVSDMLFRYNTNNPIKPIFNQTKNKIIKEII